MQKIIITGASGFIGYHLMNQLELSHQLFGLDLNQANSASIIRSQKLRSIQQLDINSMSSIDFMPDTVIHLAAETGIAPSIDQPLKYLKTNVQGTLNLLEYCRKNRINQFIYASSSSVYEPSTEPLNENSPCEHQLSFYGKTKKMCEELVNYYCCKYKMKAIGLRFFTVYGSWTRPDMAAYKFMHAIKKGAPINLYNKGKVHRDFTHVSKVTGVIDALLSKWDDLLNGQHEILNVGNGTPISIEAYAEAIAQAMKMKANYTYSKLPENELQHTHCDCSKLDSFISYEKGFAFKEGIEEMVQWFKSNPYER